MESSSSRNGRKLSHSVHDNDGVDHAETQQPTNSGSVHIEATVIYEQNRHGTLTVRDDATAANYHIVQYADPKIEKEANDLERQASVEFCLSPVGCRANVWQVDQL